MLQFNITQQHNKNIVMIY